MGSWQKVGAVVPHLQSRPDTLQLQVLTADALLAQDHPFLEDDHMFSAFVSKGVLMRRRAEHVSDGHEFCVYRASTIL